MARLPKPGGDSGSWGTILNEYLLQTHKADGTFKDGVVPASALAAGSVTTVKIAAGAVVEAKLSPALQTRLNTAAGVTSVNAKTGAVTLDKADIGLGNADDTADTDKPVSTAVQAALDGKADSGHSHSLDSLSDVSAGSATDGQVLAYNLDAHLWQPVDGGTTATDATTDQAGVVELATDAETAAGTDATRAVTPAALQAALTNVAAAGGLLLLSKYCTGDGTDEATDLQQAFTDAATNGKVLVWDVPGTIGIGATVTLGDERANGAQKIILHAVGGLRLKALVAMEAMLVQSGTVWWQGGHLELDGSSLAYFGFYGKNFGRSKGGHLHAFGCLTSGHAIEPSGNNNSFSFSSIRVWNCGDKLATTATLTARSSESGWTLYGDSATYSTWTLATPLPAHMRCRTWASPSVVFADGREMIVKSVSSDGTTIDVYHENRPVNTSESITVYTAAINWAYYGDTGIWQVGQIDVRNNANAVSFVTSGYGGNVDTYAQQANARGVVMTKRAAGLTFGYFYTEGISNMLTCRYSADASAAHPGSQVFVGPGNKNDAAIQIIDRGWMTMTGRETLPQHWIVFRESGSPFVAPPFEPLDPPITQPGTKTLTPGTIQHYDRTSGAWAFRIDNAAAPKAGGIAVLRGPKTGAGTLLQIGLNNVGTQTVMGTAIPNTTTYWSKNTWGDILVSYWLPSGGADWRVAVFQASDSMPTAITATPAYVGQMAVVGGIGYMAVGTGSTADWKQITN